MKAASCSLLAAIMMLTLTATLCLGAQNTLGDPVHTVPVLHEPTHPNPHYKVSPMPPKPAPTPTWAEAYSGGARPPPPLGDPAASYDEQLAETFPDSWVSMAWNVTAVAQVDPDGYGPAYLLNGLTDTGYWYQVGLAYDWPSVGGGVNPGFMLVYEVWGPNGRSIFPAQGGAGLANFSGPVDPGDTLSLNLYIAKGTVTMLALDYNTGAYASENYSAYGAAEFVGNPISTSNSNGYFTGLMTEQYHSSPYYGGEKFVSYTQHQAPLPSAILSMDEFEVESNGTIVGVLFDNATKVFFTNPYQPRVFSGYGATEYAEAYGFFTGQYSLSVGFRGPGELTTDAGVNEKAQFELSMVGGIPPYTIYVYLDGAQLEKYSTKTTLITLPVDFGELTLGQHQAYFVAVDSTGFSNTSQPITIQVNPDPTVNITAPNAADQHQAINVYLTIQGGTPPYNYTVYLDGQPLGQTETVVLDTLGQNQIYAAVTDHAGYTAKSTTHVVVVNPDPKATLKAASTTLDAGQRDLLVANVSGGTPPYTYIWYVDGHTVNLSATPNLTLNLNSSGDYQVLLSVVDGADYAVNTSALLLHVNPDPTFTLYTFTAGSTNPLLVGNVVHAQVNISGGTPPYTYTWYLDGVEVANTTTPTYTYHLSRMGANTLSVQVTDKAGYVLSGQTVTVNYTYNQVGLSALVAVFAAALIAFAVAMSRRR